MSFFVNNFAINIAITFMAPTVDWGAHLGGLVGGMVACALLHVFELAGPALMRCKQPEFVKVNLGILFAIAAWMTGFSPTPMLAALAVLVVAVKAIDILLSFAAWARLRGRDTDGGQRVGGGNRRRCDTAGVGRRDRMAGEPRTVGSASTAEPE